VSNRSDNDGISWRYQSRAAAVLTTIVIVVAVLCFVRGSHRVGAPVPGFLVASNRVVSTFGLRALPPALMSRIRGAQVVGMNGVPVTNATEIAARLLESPAGTPVSYRFRKGAEVFTAVLPSSKFRLPDFLALYGTSFVTALCFALGGLWPLWRGSALPTPMAFFFMCETAALCFATAGDLYGTYLLVPIHRVTYCLLPAAALHFAANYPEPIGEGPVGRRWLLAALYFGCGMLGALVVHVADDPSVLKPFLSAIHLLLGNAILLIVARVLISLPAQEDQAWRRRHVAILVGTFASILPGALAAVVSNATGTAVSPAIALGPFALFPLIGAQAVPRALRFNTNAHMTLHRLSVIFFDAVESTFLVGVVAFSFSQSWSALSQDFLLEQRRQDRIESFLEGSLATGPDQLGEIEALVETPSEHGLVLRARTAIAGRDWGAAQDAVRQLARYGDERRTRLEARQVWSGHVAVMLVVACLLVGLVQAARFALAVRRWLIGPINELLEATRAIGSGDLGYRVVPAAEEELGSLARSVNSMAASLREIQQRVEDERAARQQAAGAARDMERRRVGRELHDSVLQDLGGLKLMLEAEIKRPSQQGVQPIIDGIIGVITEVRRVVDDLRQPELASLSLAEAISDYARLRAQNQGVALHVNFRDGAAVAEWATRDAYRIAQEAITNAIRHASPRKLNVGLYQHQKEVVLEIADDGCGFEPQRLTLGTGILGMRERAAALGGDLAIESAPGKGTTIRLTFPATRAEPELYSGI